MSCCVFVVSVLVLVVVLFVVAFVVVVVPENFSRFDVPKVRVPPRACTLPTRSVKIFSNLFANGPGDTSVAQHQCVAS